MTACGIETALTLIGIKDFQYIVPNSEWPLAVLKLSSISKSKKSAKLFQIVNDRLRYWNCVLNKSRAFPFNTVPNSEWPLAVLKLSPCRRQERPRLTSELFQIVNDRLRYWNFVHLISPHRVSRLKFQIVNDRLRYWNVMLSGFPAFVRPPDSYIPFH